MNQHPKAKAAGITANLVHVDCNMDISEVNSPFRDVCEFSCSEFTRGESEAHANIMADALNTMNTHGHTPSEMVEIIRELRRVLRRYNNLSDDDILDATREYIDFEDDVIEVLNKTEDFR